jgi:hypothetical protein
MGSGAKSNMRKGFLIYEEMYNYSTIYEEVVSHNFAPDPISIYMRKSLFSFLSVCPLNYLLLATLEDCCERWQITGKEFQLSLHSTGFYLQNIV